MSSQFIYVFPFWEYKQIGIWQLPHGPRSELNKLKWVGFFLENNFPPPHTIRLNRVCEEIK